MKQLITILLLSVSITVSAQTTYYISPDGSDFTGTGSEANPLKSLYKASQVALTGDAIFIMAGIYTETQEAAIAVGVNIDGDGQGVSIINSTLNSAGHYAINLTSATQGTLGDQYIRNITLTGSSLTALQGIGVIRRSNVHIYNVTLKDFSKYGVMFDGKTTYATRPTTYSSGNRLYNDSIINCSDRGSGGAGMIGMSGQDGMQIYNCYLNQTQRPPGHNGNIVFAVGGFNKNFKFYNNESIKPDTDGTISDVSTGWNMHLETWDNDGGNEAYNNTFIGGVALDIGYHAAVKGDADYSWKFHDNVVKLRSMQASGEGTRTSAGVVLETAGSDLYIYNNHFINLPEPVSLGGNPENTYFSNAFIHNNIFENTGFSNTSWSAAIIVNPDSDDTIRNVYIDNNTFYNSDRSKAGHLLRFNSQNNAVLKNVVVRNNILTNSNTSFLVVVPYIGIIDSVNFDNNIIYNNGYNNKPIYQGSIPTNITYTNTLNQNPLLNTVDFSLIGGSPAIDAAIDLGYGSNIGAIQDTLIVPVITWTNPSAITYGTSLSSTQLNASTSVAGTFSYNYSSGTLLNAGSYTLITVFTPTDGTTYSTATKSVTLTVNKATATLSYSGLTKTYNGLPQSPTVSISPSGLTGISTTYDGVGSPPTNAGSYTVVSGLNNPNYSAMPITNTFTINKATATITVVSSLNQIADGNPKTVSATTNPSGLALTITYDGSPTAPSEAGTYAVHIEVVDGNYEGSKDVTLEITAPSAAITITNLLQTYDGNPKSVTITTIPSSLPYDITYNGLSVSSVTNAGNYTAIATLNDGVHTGADTAILVIQKANPVLSWATPQPVQVGTKLSSIQLNATSNVEGTFVYSLPEGTVLTEGTKYITAAFTPSNSNYNTATISILLNVYGNPITNFIIGDYYENK